MIQIRLATQADSPNIVSVIKEVYDEYGFTWEAEGYHADLYDLNSYYFDLGNKFWIAIQDGLTIGTVALDFINPSLPSVGDIVEYNSELRVAGADCALNRLYVRPTARKNGCGQQLLAKVIETAKEAGCKRMELWSDKRFTKAHQLYGKFGSTVVGERICDDPDVSPEWGLRIDL